MGRCERKSGLANIARTNDKDLWPPNSLDLNQLDYCVWGAMLDEFNKFNSKPQNTSELKMV